MYMEYVLLWKCVKCFSLYIQLRRSNDWQKYHSRKYNQFHAIKWSFYMPGNSYTYTYINTHIFRFCVKEASHHVDSFTGTCAVAVFFVHPLFFAQISKVSLVAALNTHTEREKDALHTCSTNPWDKSDATMNFCVRLASIYCVLFISSIMLRAFHNKTDEMTSERRKCCRWWWWWWNAYVLCTNCITCATSWWAIYWHLIEMYVLARK